MSYFVYLTFQQFYPFMKYIGLFFYFFLLYTALQAQQYLYPYTAQYLDKAYDQEEEVLAAFIREGVEQANQKGHLDSVALLYHEYGLALYYLEKYSQAIEVSREAASIRQGMEPMDTFGVSRSIYNMGFYFYKLGQPDSSIYYYKEVIAIGAVISNDKFAHACFEIGKAYNYAGDLKQAAQYLELGEQYLINIGELTARQEKVLGQIYFSQGNNFNSMKQPHQAIEYFEKAIALYEDQERISSKYICINGLGSAYEELGQLTKAAEAYGEALAYYRSEGEQEEVMVLLNNLAIVFTNLGQYDRAESMLKEALQIGDQLYGSPPHVEKASMYDNLGDLRRKKGAYAQALECYQRAIEQMIPEFSKAEITDNPDEGSMKNVFRKINLLTYLANKAGCLQQYALLTKDEAYADIALHTYFLADALIDQMQEEQDVRASRLFWRQEAHDLYENAIASCYQFGRVDQVLHFFEKSKSILLLDALLESDARALIPDSIANKALHLNRQLSEMSAELEAAPQNNHLRKELIALQEKRNTLSNTIAQSYPQYYSIRYGQQIIEEEALHSICSTQGQAIFHYFYGKDAIYVLIAHANAPSKLIRLNGNMKTINQAILSFSAFFQSAKAITNAPADYALAAHRLYQLLFEPAARELPDSIHKITLILDGPLHYLPFEAFISELPNKVRLGRLPYLLEDYQIGYAYSATILQKQLLLQQQSLNQQMKVLAYAPFNKTARENWPVLQSSTEELAHLSKRFSGAFFTDQKATLGGFLHMAARFPVIHLSTHALSDVEGQQPHILFQDTALYLSSLYALPLNANLIVLSACQTNIGGLVTGEGVMSLASGFAYTGTQSLISSLWNANDFSTARLFENFYTRLNEGTSKMEALQGAKLAYLQSEHLSDAQKSPYYWAGFVFIGSDGGIDLAPASMLGSTGWMIIMLIGGLLLGGWSYWRSRR
jgi:CHAT domain-containing protein